MDYRQVCDSARGNIGPFCKACYVCNGVACKNTIPGPGAKGNGDVAIRNWNKWQEIRVNMDTLCENCQVDTSVTLFGKKLDIPVFAGPVGAVKLHYGEKHTDLEFNDILLKGTMDSGIAAFTGDGTNPLVMESATQVIKKYDGCGVPTIKPWNIDTIKEKFSLVKESGCFAVAMDVDAAGLPFLKNMTPPAGSKTVEQLAEIVSLSPAPFIVKGVMTVKGALKAKQAGAAAIVVSNHGGRVLDGTPSTAEVLPEIVKAVKGQMTILVDGGIRSGLDVFKALALGADGVVIARPFVTAVYGGGEEGIRAYVDKLKAELSDVMSMCGAATIADINSDMLYL
ncbi:MAG: alpha-hydroxy-acid oxidizing protein [Oscillospiraceae bacterium]|nr:alpha-hydroxy-acid oxidizing protein [Oscillospiraceae bacterium]